MAVRDRKWSPALRKMIGSADLLCNASAFEADGLARCYILLFTSHIACTFGSSWREVASRLVVPVVFRAVFPLWRILASQ